MESPLCLLPQSSNYWFWLQNLRHWRADPLCEGILSSCEAPRSQTSEDWSSPWRCCPRRPRHAWSEVRGQSEVTWRLTDRRLPRVTWHWGRASGWKLETFFPWWCVLSVFTGLVTFHLRERVVMVVFTVRNSPCDWLGHTGTHTGTGRITVGQRAATGLALSVSPHHSLFDMILQIYININLNSV